MQVTKLSWIMRHAVSVLAACGVVHLSAAVVMDPAANPLRIYEPHHVSPQPTPPDEPEEPWGVTATPVPPEPRPRATITGRASWYCKEGISPCHRSYPPGSMVAAACSSLRNAMGFDWRGRTVTVTNQQGVAVAVRLVDWCASTDKLIDLYAAPFAKLAPTSLGTVLVDVSWPTGSW